MRALFQRNSQSFDGGILRYLNSVSSVFFSFVIFFLSCDWFWNSVR